MIPFDTRSKQCMPRESSAAPQRPHTRAYAKSHGLNIKTITLDDLDSATSTARSRQGLKISSRLNVKPPPEKASEKPESTPHSQQVLLDKSGPQSDPPGTQIQGTVSAWLDVVSLGAPQISSPARPIPSSGAASSELSDMESSSSVNTSRSATNEVAASTKASTVKEISFAEHLQFRGINNMPSNDPKLQALGIQETIDNAPSSIEFRNFDSLMKILDHFSKTFRRSIRDQSSENGLPTYDALRYEIGRWRPVAEEYRRFPPMAPEDFNWDRGQCVNSSEADFHRTIMISIIDRYDLQNLFAFSCEEQWAVGRHFLIKPTRPKSRISQPKPDLALSFQRSALIDDDLLDYPVELGKCLHPGTKGFERWFPFVFIEAKRDDNSLRDAFEKALHSASQALFNIYQWMCLIPELEEQFFNDVRVFTIVLNNQDITLRIHRAERGSGDRFRYRFAEVAVVRDYDQFKACHMVKSVLVDYGLPHLYPILKNTYRLVAKMDQPGQTGTKRKQDVLNTQPSAQSPEAPNTPQLHSSSTGLSFDAGEMELSQSGSTPKRSRGRARGGR